MSGMCIRTCVEGVCAGRGRVQQEWGTCERLCADTVLGSRDNNMCGVHCLYTPCVPMCPAVNVPSTCEFPRTSVERRRVGETLPSSLPGGQGPAWLLAQGPALEGKLQPLLTSTHYV